MLRPNYDSETPHVAAREVLRRLEKASETRDERVCIAFKKHDWDIGQRQSPSSQRISADMISQISRDYHRLRYMKSLLQALNSSISELEELYQNLLGPIATKLSKGLSMLPDEILIQVIKFAASDGNNGTRNAICLSQVSSRFRRITLSDWSLWTTLNLWHDTTKEELETIIARSGTESDLNAVINMNASISGEDARRFMDDCSHTAPRWRTLTVNRDLSWTQNDRGFTMDAILGQLVYYYDLTLPRLDELIVSECQFDELAGQRVWVSDSRAGDWYEGSQPWIAPKLSLLRCADFIPLPSFPFTSISTFSLSFTLIEKSVQDQIGKLVEFLSSMRSITTFELLLKNGYPYLCDDIDPEIPNQMVTVSRSVTSFTLQVSDFSLQVGGNKVLEAIMRPFQFPNLNRFSLTVKLSDVDLGFRQPQTIDLIPSFLSVLFPDPAVHSLLATLDVKLPLSEREARLYFKDKGKCVVLAIPLDRVPNVSTMTVTTCGQLIFSRSRVQDSDASGPSLYDLRELQLHSCENMDVEILQATIRSLKDVNAWDTLDRVVIQDCSLLDYNSALMAVGNERLRFIE